MKTRSTVWMASVLVSAPIAIAAAQGDTDATGDPSGSAAADPSGAATPDPNAGATVEATASAPASRYPRDVISRVLTLPKGLISVGADIATNTNAFFDPATLRPVVGYGITDDLEVNFAAYAFPTSDVGGGSIDGGVGYKLARGAMDGKLEVIGRVQTGYSLSGEAMNPLLLGVHVQYNITPKIAVITPGGQISVALAGDVKPITAQLPVALGVQLTPTLYAQLDTSLATFKIKDSANAFIFADSTPLLASVVLNAIPALDVIAGFGLNLTPPDTVDMMGNPMEVGVGDTMVLLVGARYYIGQL
jgi:hypothetical protein